MKHKRTIEIKGIYTGKSQPHRKNGDPMNIMFTKDLLIAEYIQRTISMSAYTDEKISLIEYVRERTDRIFKTGIIFY